MPAKKLNLTIASLSLTLLTACNSLDPISTGFLTGSMDTSFELMQGNGSIVRTSEGKTKFTFVIHDLATSKFFDKNDLEGQENFRLNRLGAFLASKQECPNGYQVTKVEPKPDDAHLYDGFCK
jgi:hypothetical protein